MNKKFIQLLKNRVRLILFHLFARANSCIIKLDKNLKYHCEDGPAVIHKNGDKFWYKHGKRHRTDGPACEFVLILERGKVYQYQWYVNDIRFDRDESIPLEVQVALLLLEN